MRIFFLLFLFSAAMVVTAGSQVLSDVIGVNSLNHTHTAPETVPTNIASYKYLTGEPEVAVKGVPIWLTDKKTTVAQKVRALFATHGFAPDAGNAAKAILWPLNKTTNTSITAEAIAGFRTEGLNCTNSPLTFFDSSKLAPGITIVKWLWNFGNGSEITSVKYQPQMVRYSESGKYNVTLQIETNTGFKSAIFTKEIIIHPRPFANFSIPVVCLPSGIARFTNLSSIDDKNESRLAYLWEFGDNSSHVVRNPVHVYTATGPFTVKLTVTSSYGCFNDTTQQLTSILDRPKARFTTTEHVCLGDSITFKDQSMGNGSNIVKWRWKFGDRKVDSVQNPVHKYKLPGNYKASLYTITDQGCISDTFYFSPVVYPLPVADFITSVPLCELREFTITDKSIANAGIIKSWNWSFGDNAKAIFSTSSPFTRQYQKPGDYIIKEIITTDKGCVSDTAFKKLTVYPSPIVTAGADLFIPEGRNAVLNGDAEGVDLIYRWTPATYLDNPGVLKPIVTPAADIIYQLTVTSPEGCTSSDQVFIKILKSPFIPNAFSPNGDGINDTWMIKYLESYPGSTIRVYNRDGQPVFSYKNYSKPWDGTFHGKVLPAGVYYYVINTGTEKGLYSGSVTIVR